MSRSDGTCFRKWANIVDAWVEGRNYIGKEKFLVIE